MSDIRFNQWLHQSGTGGVSQSDGGHVGIGTTNPLLPVGAGNTHILHVGVVTSNSISAGSSITATTFYGSGANLTGLNTDLLSDTSPQLGADLDTNGFGILVDDNKVVNFGNNNDLMIYHSGTHSYIKNKTNNLYIMSTNTEYGIEVHGNGKVRLNYDNSPKIETTNTGAIVTGIVTATSRLSVGNNTTNAVDLEFGTNRGSAGQTIANINWKWNNTYVAQIRGMAGSDTTNKDDAHLNFYTAPSGSLVERLRITSSGHLKMPDAKEIQLGNDDQTATGDLRIFHNGSNSGIINSQGALYIQNTATNSSDLHLQGKSSIQFHCPADGTTPLRITSSGRVGINEASPAALLHIDSDDTTPPVTIDTATNNRGIIVKNPNGGDGSIWAYGNSNTMDWSFTTYSTNPLLYLKNNGNVGIQTNDPDYVLDLGGTALNQDDGTEYTLRIRSNNNKTAIRVGSGGGGSRVALMRFDGDSNPGNGVGCSGQTDLGAFGGTLVYHGDRSGNENSFAIYMDQNAAASQIEAFNIRQNGDYMHGGSSYSDRDQKENITAISGTALDKITQLSPKTWNWKPEYHDIPTDRIFAGFIAQEVQPHIPSIVTGTDGQGDMALDYQGLLAWTIKAVTELNTKVETLEAKVSALEGS